MKKNTFLLCFILSAISYNLKATVRTVNNNNPSPGQFTTLVSAVNASSSGDTVYVSGSATGYGTLGLFKPIVFIGTGHNPDKQSPLSSIVTYIDLASGSQGSKFLGLTFISQSFFVTSGNLNVEFRNCKFTNFAYGAASNNVSGIAYNGCVFAYSNSSTPVLTSTSSDTISVAFSNCIFTSVISDANTTLTGSFTNCQFHGTGSTGFLTRAYSLTVSNSIFYGVIPQITGSLNTGTVASRNMTFNATNNNFNFTSVLTNQIGVNPLYTSYTGSAPFFAYSHDYRLSASSTGNNYGTDGKDVGVYGGSYNFYMGGEPNTIPVIREMNLQGPTTIPAGGTINVNVISNVKP